jgi:sec-independent protein translocase protein TatA
MLGFHWPELIIVFAVLLLLFGGKRLPEIGSSIGKSITAFRSGLNEAKAEPKPELKEGVPAPTLEPAPEPEKVSER